MGGRNWRVSAAIIGLALVAGPVAAQTPIDDSLTKRDARRLDNMEKVVRELRSIVFQARDTKQPVVVQPADTNDRLQDLASRLSDLENSLTRINGQLDTTAHDLALMKQQNADLKAQVKALTDEVATLEKAATAAAPPPGDSGSGATEATGSTPPPAAAKPDPAEAFAHARQLMLNGDYDGAETAFRNYVQTFPDAPKSQEARYWWGKTLVVRGAHADAATAFIGAIRGWPQATWAPDAVVELSRQLVDLRKPADACEALAELPRKYPKASASVKARASETRALAKCK